MVSWSSVGEVEVLGSICFIRGVIVSRSFICCSMRAMRGSVS